MTGHVINHVPALLKKVGGDEMALVREAGLGISTAYRVADPEAVIQGVQFETEQKLCAYFSRKLGRKITRDDLFTLVPEGSG